MKKNELPYTHLCLPDIFYLTKKKAGTADLYKNRYQFTS